MTIENIKEIMDGVDIAALLPDIHKLVEKSGEIARVLILVGPVLILFLGLYYFLISPKEANYTTGYRFHWGMGSEQAWQFMQKLAGMVWMVIGLVLLIAMAILGGSLAEMEIMDLLWQAAKYLAVQAVVALAGCLLINLVVFIRFDYKGNRRLSWKELNDV